MIVTVVVVVVVRSHFGSSATVSAQASRGDRPLGRTGAAAPQSQVMAHTNVKDADEPDANGR